MRDIKKKYERDRRRHQYRMLNDLDYRLRRLLTTMRARCLTGNGRTDWQYYGAKGLEVTVTLDDLKTLWRRDGAEKMKRPDIDRINNDLGYTLENCRFIEHADNMRRMIPLRRKRRWYRKPAEQRDGHQEVLDFNNGHETQARPF